MSVSSKLLCFFQSAYSYLHDGKHKQTILKSVYLSICLSFCLSGLIFGITKSILTGLSLEDRRSCGKTYTFWEGEKCWSTVASFCEEVMVLMDFSEQQSEPDFLRLALTFSAGPGKRDASMCFFTLRNRVKAGHYNDEGTITF